jgi:hypothetical protein
VQSRDALQSHHIPANQTLKHVLAFIGSNFEQFESQTAVSS